MEIQHHRHDDGRECWSWAAGAEHQWVWYYRTTSTALAAVSTTKPFIGRCDRPHRKA